MLRLLTPINAWIARLCMFAAVAGLLLIVAVVAWQVFGRYVLNDTPTWAESLALVLVLYVTMFGAAVGVRDAGHIGLESVLAYAVAERHRIWFEYVIHVLVGPHTFNFAEITEAFLAADAVIQVRNEHQFDEVVSSLMNDPIRRARLGAAARALVQARRGARDKTLAVINELLPRQDRRAVVRPFRVVH
jgi:hypothetical protein